MLEADTVNRILRFRGNGVPVVSLYAPVGAGAARREVNARVSSLLAEIHPLARDSALTHEARMSVRADIERIKEALGQERWQPGAIAIFSCSGRDMYEEVPLPRRVRERIIVDATAFSRPMLAVVDKAAMGGLATVGLANCLWGGTLAAIQALVVEEEATAPGVVCDQSGWLALSGDICPLCGCVRGTSPVRKCRTAAA